MIEKMSIILFFFVGIPAALLYVVLGSFLVKKIKEDPGLWGALGEPQSLFQISDKEKFFRFLCCGEASEMQGDRLRGIRLATLAALVIELVLFAILVVGLTLPVIS